MSGKEGVSCRAVPNFSLLPEISISLDLRNQSQACCHHAHPYRDIRSCVFVISSYTEVWQDYFLFFHLLTNSQATITSDQVSLLIHPWQTNKQTKTHKVFPKGLWNGWVYKQDKAFLVTSFIDYNSELQNWNQTTQNCPGHNLSYLNYISVSNISRFIELSLLPQICF